MLYACAWLDLRQKAAGDENFRAGNREALNTLQNLEGEYKAFVIAKCIKPREVAMKMMNGEFLNEDEERFLLIKLEI